MSAPRTALAACAILSGCSLIADRDLHIADAAVTGIAYDDPYAPGWDKPGDQNAFVDVTFSADRDLIAYSDEYDHSLYAEASRCTGGAFDASKLVRVQSYFHKWNGEVDDRSEPPQAGAPGIWRYRISLNLAAHVVPTDASDAFDYDLRAQPQDVCIHIRGAQMLGRSYVSNTLVIPKAAIAEAIAKAAP